MSLLTSLLLLIVVARLLGRLLVRLGQPALVGEILAGLLLGPSLLGLIESGPALAAISELAVFLVVLSAGLEMNFQDVLGVLRKGRGMFVALLGFALPFAGGIALGILFELDVMRTVFLGLCVSITALPVAVRMLDSFGLLGTEIANYSVATAIVNDLLALLILGVILDLPAEGTYQGLFSSILITGGKLILLAVFVIGFSLFLEWADRRASALSTWPEKLVAWLGPEALFGVVVAFVLVFGAISEVLGFHFVIGAFFGALLIDKKYFLASRYSELERTLASVTGGFLAPVFFASLGLEFKILEMQSWQFVVSVLLVSIITKLVAGWVGGRFVGMSNADSWGLGVILNGRGVMELVVAGIAYQRGFIGSGLFSTLVLMGVVTTLLTPLLFERLKKKVKPGRPLTWESRG